MTTLDTPEPPVRPHMRVGGFPELRLSGPWSPGFALMLVLASVLLGFGVAMLFALEGFMALEGAAAVVARTLALSGPYAIIVGIVVLAARSRGMSLVEGLGFRSFDALDGAALALGGAVGGRIMATVWSFAIVLLGFEPPADLDITRLFPVGPSGAIGLVVVAVVVGPIAEEIVFRGVLQSAMRDRVGPKGAAVMSSAVFGIVHVDILWMVVPTFLLGVVLAWLFESTRSLWVPILCHVTFNLTAVVLALLARALGAL